MFNYLFGRALMRWLDKLGDRGATVSPGVEADRAPEAEPMLEPTIELHEDDDEPEIIDIAVELPEGDEIVYPRVQRRAMGSLFEVYLAGVDRHALVGAAEEALDEVERLERQLSVYRPDSDISRLNAYASEQWVRLEPQLYALLQRCYALGEQTDGAFDITAGPLVRAWGFREGKGRVPPAEELQALLSRVGIYRLLFDDDDHLVFSTAPGLEIDLGAVGKGYAIDRAAEILRFYYVPAAVLHAGQSTIYALGSPPDGDAWEFVIRDPRDHETPIQTIRLRDEALSTSGSYEQFFEADGVRYSHILDPRTGRPTQGMLSVSVVARSAADSDALSTALYVLGREAAQEFCRDRPELRVVMIESLPGGEIAVTRIGLEDDRVRTTGCRV